MLAHCGKMQTTVLDNRERGSPLPRFWVYVHRIRRSGASNVSVEPGNIVLEHRAVMRNIFQLKNVGNYSIFDQDHIGTAVIPANIPRWLDDDMDVFG